jgi:hypothetical protein
MRVEVMPIDGLNAGVFLRARHSGSDQPHSSHRLSYALANTSFGARFAPAGGLFGVAAGLELRSQHERADIMAGDPIYDAFDWPVFASENGPSVRGTFAGGYGGRPFRAGGGNNDLSTLGVNAYVGTGLNLMDGLQLEIGVNLLRLDDFNYSGTIHLHQRVGFDLDIMNVGLDLHQVLLTGYMSRDFGPAAGDRGPIDFALRFVPNVGVNMGDTDLSVSIPLTVAPSWSRENYTGFAFGIEPSVSHQMGAGFSIGAWYRLGYNNQGGVTGANNEIENRLGVDFIWTF